MSSSLSKAEKAKRQELVALNAEIAERTQYKKDQEKQINELVETGNTQLMALSHDIEVAKKELRDLKTDLRKNKQDKVLLNEDLTRMRTEAVELDTRLSVAPAFG